jgi:hypothetical protein
LESKYWLDGINKVLDGTTDSDFTDNFIQFCLEFSDFCDLNQHQIKVLSDKSLQYDKISQKTHEAFLKSAPKIKRDNYILPP